MRNYHRWLYATSVFLWATGVGWLVSHYLTGTRDAFGLVSHPFDEWWLRAHGAVMMAFLIVLGTLVPSHMDPWWHRRRNRGTAIVMLSVVAILILTGYGLYYSADEALRYWIRLAHWIIGVGALPSLIAHRAFGKPRKVSRAPKRGAGTRSRRSARATPLGSAKSSGGLEEPHEPEVHVQLHVAVEEGQTRLVGDEIHVHRLVAAQHRDVLMDAGGGSSVEPRQLERVAVEVHGMDVVTCIAHAQPIAVAALQAPGHWHRLHVERSAVDRPAIESVIGRVVLGEEHLDGLIGSSRLPMRVGE